METFRRSNKEGLRKLLKKALPKNLRNAFTYIHTLDYKDKPDYNLLKLFFAVDEAEMNIALKSQLKIEP